MSVTTGPVTNWRRPQVQQGWLARLFDSKIFLIIACLTPALGLLLVFLTYPLGLGIWLAFTDTHIGRGGVFIGFENFESLWYDRVFWGAVFYTVFYTGVATALKFALGLWLALLLNENLPFKSLLRAIILLPWIVPTVLSAIAFWWIYDAQFSIISYVLVDKLGCWTITSTSWARPGRRAGRWSPPTSGAAFPLSPSAARGPADHLALALRSGVAGWRILLAALPAHHLRRC
jgi:ABC-type polysaccharide transport system permease subunit